MLGGFGTRMRRKQRHKQEENGEIWDLWNPPSSLSIQASTLAFLMTQHGTSLSPLTRPCSVACQIWEQSSYTWGNLAREISRPLHWLTVLLNLWIGDCTEETQPERPHLPARLVFWMVVHVHNAEPSLQDEGRWPPQGQANFPEVVSSQRQSGLLWINSLVCFGRSKKRRIFLRRCYWVFAKEAHEDCVGHSSKLPGEAVIELSVQHYTNKASDVVQSLPGEPLWQIQVKHDARPSVTSLVHPAISWVLESWVGPAAQYVSYILCNIYTSIYNFCVYLPEFYVYIYLPLCI